MLIAGSMPRIERDFPKADKCEERHVKRWLGENRWDLALFAGLVMAGAVLAGCYLMQYAGTAQQVPVLVVSVSGEPVQRYSLEQDVDVVLYGANGGTNHLHIKNGQAWLSEASCPDKVCVHMGIISEEGQSIICLPNRMVLEVVRQ